MTNIASLTVLLCITTSALLTGCSQKGTDELLHEGIKPLMDRKEVRQIEEKNNLKPSNDTENSDHYEEEITALNTVWDKMVYFYKDDKLVGMYLGKSSEEEDNDDFLSDFSNVDKALTKQYGDPQASSITNDAYTLINYNVNGDEEQYLSLAREFVQPSRENANENFGEYDFYDFYDIESYNERLLEQDDNTIFVGDYLLKEKDEYETRVYYWIVDNDTAESDSVIQPLPKKEDYYVKLDYSLFNELESDAIHGEGLVYDKINTTEKYLFLGDVMSGTTTDQDYSVEITDLAPIDDYNFTVYYYLCRLDNYNRISKSEDKRVCHLVKRDTPEGYSVEWSFGI